MNEDKETKKEQEDDYTKVFGILPINKERKEKILDLTKTADFRALLLNNLILSLSSPATSEFDAATKYAEARGIAKLLTATLKATKIE